MKPSEIARIILSCMLVIAVYTETGLFTALVIALQMIQVEMQTKLNKTQADLNKTFFELHKEINPRTK